MSRIAKSALALVSGLALVLGLVSGATAQSTSAHHVSTKVVKSTHKSSSSAAKKAAIKRAAAKKAAAKRAAAKKAAAKKAAAKRAAAWALAAKKAAAKKVAENSKQAARTTLMNNILNFVTPDAPNDLPSELATPDPSQTDPSGGDSSGVASMPIRCMAVYRDGKSACGWYGPGDSKPTAQQFAFNEALKAAYNVQAEANQVAYDAFEAATVEARDAINQSITKGDSEGEWMQSYLDYLVATRDAQAQLNTATLASNEVFVEAKYAAIADFDAATFDASTDSGAAALSAIADYRAASKALELEQFAKNLSDSADLNESIIKRMQAYIDVLATLSSEDDINAARDAYWADLSSVYYATAVASNDALKSFYDAVKTAEDAFLELTGDSPSHPEWYPWWWYNGDDPIIIIDPVPGDCVDEPLHDSCLPPVPGDSGDQVDSGQSDGSGDPAIAICPPYPGEFNYPRPVPPETDNSDSSGNADDSGSADDAGDVDGAQTGDPVVPVQPDCLAPAIQ